MVHSRCYQLTAPFYSGIGTILMLHRVCPPTGRTRLVSNAVLEITPEYLEHMIAFFRERRYEIVSLDRLCEILNNENKNERCIAFTFDDGYADNYTYAYPIFKKHNIPFSVFVITSFPEKKAILWWYLLEDLILENSCIRFELDGDVYNLKCETPDKKEITFLIMRRLIMDTEEGNQLFKVKKIFEEFSVDLHQKTDELALSWEQIQQLSADPLVTIGSHTVNHCMLRELPLVDMQREVVEATQIIESHIDKKVEHFSYPYGSVEAVGPREFNFIRKCGFKMAVTGRCANIFHEHREHLECLPRFTINGENSLSLLTLMMKGILPFLRNKGKRIVTD